MENFPFIVMFPLKMVIFYSFVSLPEGNESADSDIFNGSALSSADSPLAMLELMVVENWLSTDHLEWMEVSLILVVSNMAYIFHHGMSSQPHWRTYIFQDGYPLVN